MYKIISYGTRDGAAEPVSRDQILRHARRQGNIIFPVQLTTSRIGNITRLIHTLLYVMTIHIISQCVNRFLCVLTSALHRSARQSPFPSKRRRIQESPQWLASPAPLRALCLGVRLRHFAHGARRVKADHSLQRLNAILPEEGITTCHHIIGDTLRVRVEVEG